jgi:hypothetical protein
VFIGKTFRQAGRRTELDKALLVSWRFPCKKG